MIASYFSMCSGNAGAHDQMDDAAGSSFLSALRLGDEPIEHELVLPFANSASVSHDDCVMMKRWVGLCERSRILGTPLKKLRPISAKYLNAFAKWKPITGQSSRCVVLQGAVRHLRDRIDVSNMQRIRSSSELFDKGLEFFSVDKMLRKVKFRIRARLGISGFSYGQLFAEAILGDGGHAEFKAGLQQVRQSTSSPEEVRGMKFKSCLSILPEPYEMSRSSERHRRAVARLVFLARHQVVTDMAGRIAGASTESLLVQELLRAGLRRADFFTEDQLRSAQKQTFGKTCLPTPDVLFRRPVVLSTGMSPVRWIDAKDVVVLPGCTMNVRIHKFREQMERYTRFYGKGAVVWRHGWPTSLGAPKSVSFLRFRETGPTPEDGDVERRAKRRKKGQFDS